MSDNDKPQIEIARGTLGLSADNTAAPDPLEARMRRALGLEGDQLRLRPQPDRADSSAPRPAERFTPGTHKRRFVHDGEVPVTVVHGVMAGRRENGDSRAGNNGQPTNRLEAAETALASEVAARERAERALHEAQSSIHELRTKCGHAELALQEANGALRREREAHASLHEAVQAAEAEAEAARLARDAAEQALAELRAQRADVAALAPSPTPARRGRKPKEAVAVAAVDIAPAPRKMAAGKRTRSTEAKPAREPKPIRWWLPARKKKQR